MSYRSQRPFRMRSSYPRVHPVPPYIEPQVEDPYRRALYVVAFLSGALIAAVLVTIAWLVHW